MKKKTIFFAALFFFIIHFSSAQDLLSSLLKERTSLVTQKVIANKRKYRLQIIYTQVNRDKNNVPSFKQYSMGLDDEEYFYPASLVKLPTIALALEKLDSLNIPGLNKYSRVKIDSAYQCQKPVLYDSTAKDNYPSIAHYVKKMLLVSDNNAYNRLFEFLGPEYINRHLAKMGYGNAGIFHRLSFPCEPITNCYTNPFTFFDASGKAVYQQPLTVCPKLYSNPLEPKVGKGFMNEKRRLVKQPKDFSQNNYLPLSTINSVLVSLFFPLAVESKKRFNLTDDDYTFIYKYMQMYPRESDYPFYDEKKYPDNYKKYYESDTVYKKITEDSVRIFNVVGLAYGFMSDCSYIVNIDKKIEFFLSTVIYVNENNVINSGRYEYYRTGFPFLTDLEKTIYNYEFSRNKEYPPNFSNFKFR